MQETIKKAENSPLSTTDLLVLLSRERDFIGIFASDELSSIYVLIEPVFFIVNLDIAAQSGSHWISIRVGKTSVDIFDSLGFSYDLWSLYPEHLIHFLNRYKLSHRFNISPVLQQPNTYLCGLYCLYFIFYRQILSFTNCVRKFSLDLELNNRKLITLLLKHMTK